MKHRGLLFILSIFLMTACASTKQTVSTPTPQTSPSPLDGTWQGSGKDASGKAFVLTLKIENDSLTSMLYQFPGNDGIACYSSTHQLIPLSEQPKITADKLSATLSKDVVLSASFLTDGTASGHLTAHWHDRQPRCNGDYEVNWTATKQTVQAP